MQECACHFNKRMLVPASSWLPHFVNRTSGTWQQHTCAEQQTPMSSMQSCILMRKVTWSGEWAAIGAAVFAGRCQVPFPSAKQPNGSHAKWFHYLLRFLLSRSVLHTCPPPSNMPLFHAPPFLHKHHPMHSLHTIATHPPAWAYLVLFHLVFDAAANICRGITFETVLKGLSQAIAESPVDASLILCIERGHSEVAAANTLVQALPYLENITTVGLAGPEVGNPPGKFQNVFYAATQLNLHKVAHAGVWISACPNAQASGTGASHSIACDCPASHAGNNNQLLSEGKQGNCISLHHMHSHLRLCRPSHLNPLNPFCCGHYNTPQARRVGRRTCMRR